MSIGAGGFSRKFSCSSYRLLPSCAASFWMTIIVLALEVVPRSAVRCGDRIVLKSGFEAVTGEAVANTTHARRLAVRATPPRSHATVFSLVVGR